jgi:hypothetical protein
MENTVNVGSLVTAEVIRGDNSFFDRLGVLNKVQVFSYREFEHLWSYGGKLVVLTRNLLNAMVRTPYIVCLAGVNSAENIKATVTHLKLFSVVSIPFSLGDIKALVAAVGKSIAINDQEGAALGSLSLAITAADAVDSTSTFINSMLAVSARASIEMLSAIALPLGLGISVTGTFSRTIQLAKTLSVYQKIHLSYFSEKKYRNKELFRRDVEKALGVFEEQKLIEWLSYGSLSQDILDRVESLKEKKKSIISRLIPKDAQEEYEKIFKLLDVKSSEHFTDDEFESALEGIKNIQMHLEKKMNLSALGILANLIVISALVLFSIGTAGARPFVLMATAFVIRLISLVYQDQKIEKVSLPSELFKKIV